MDEPVSKRFHVTTFGCQMNEHDSERMKGMLGTLGYRESATREDADLILFNTCSIREAADNRFIAHLGEAKRLKAESPGTVVGVGGCWAQSVKDEVFERFPFVDVAFGPGQIHKLAEFIASDAITAQGFFEFEEFAGHLPTQRDREFHSAIVRSCGNSVLIDTVQRFWDARRGPMFERMVDHFETPESWNAAIDEHRKVLAAIRSHDAAQARIAMHEHMDRSHTRFNVSWRQTKRSKETRP